MTHTMRILDHTGHTTYAWDDTGATKTVGGQGPVDIDMAEVRERFEQLVRGQHWLATTIVKEGDGPATGDVVREFDPQADVILQPQPIGG